MKKLIFTIVLAGICSGLFAQSYIAKMQLDTNAMLIGDQIKLTLTITGEKGKQILFPHFCDTCLLGFEIVNRSGIDTTMEENKMELTQNLTLTSFEEGNYAFSPISFYDIDSVLLAQTLETYLQVKTIEVDTLLPIKDIKKPLPVPITWKEILFYGGISLGVAAVLAGIVLLIRYLTRKKKPITLMKEKSKVPAHILALEALNKLWQKKLCASGYIKEHYSELSDIIRIYIENRWEVSAMEMVSSEIIDSLKNFDIQSLQMKKLEQMLYMADMVKFAKAHPLPDENSLHYQNMVEFVKTTSPVPLNTNLNH